MLLFLRCITYEKAISNTRMYRWSKSETIQVYVQDNEQGYEQGYNEIIQNIQNWLDLACTN
jgi:hypothetical protein